MTEEQLDCVVKSLRRWAFLGLVAVLVILPVVAASLSQPLQDLRRAQHAFASVVVQQGLFGDALVWRRDNSGEVSMAAAEELRLVEKALGPQSTVGAQARTQPHPKVWHDKSVSLIGESWNNRVIIRVGELYLRGGTRPEFQVLVNVADPEGTTRRFRFFQQDLNVVGQLTWWYQELEPEFDLSRPIGDGQAIDPMPMPIGHRFLSARADEIISIARQHGLHPETAKEAIELLRAKVFADRRGLTDSELSVPGTGIELPLLVGLPVLAVIAVAVPLFASRSLSVLGTGVAGVRPKTEVLLFDRSAASGHKQTVFRRVERWGVALGWMIAIAFAPIVCLATTGWLVLSGSLGERAYGSVGGLFLLLAAFVVPFSISNIYRIWTT